MIYESAPVFDHLVGREWDDGPVVCGAVSRSMRLPGLDGFYCRIEQAPHVPLRATHFVGRIVKVKADGAEYTVVKTSPMLFWHNAAKRTFWLATVLLGWTPA